MPFLNFRLLHYKNSEILTSLNQYKSLFKYVGLFTAIINLLYLVPSIYMLEVYDRVMTSSNTATLLFLTIIILFLYLMMSALEYVRSAMVIKIGEQIDLSLNQRIYNASFSQNLKPKKINAGQAINDLTVIRQFVTGNGLFAFFDAPWFPIYLVVIFLFNVWMGAFALFSVVVLVSLAWINEKATEDPLKEANQFAIQSSTTATNVLRNPDSIHAMGMLSSHRMKWFNLHSQFLNAQAKGSMNAGYITALSKFFRLAMQSLILGLGALLAIEHQISSGMVIAGSILLGRALAPVDLLIGVWRHWTSVLSAFERLNLLLEHNPEIPASLQLPKPKGEIQLENITVKLEGRDQAVLQNISLQLEPGDCLAVIGLNGAGKSTFSKVLVGLITPTEGKARIDDSDIYLWDREDLGQYVGYLPQQPILFAGTIAENICRFSEINSEKILKAATQAGIHEIILRLPKGYETPLGDGGQGLSGGQIQRIALAQALYNDPALIVLDEPNSNLDQSGEADLIQTLKTLQLNKQTVIFVSHSVNLIRQSSKLLLLENGMVKMFDHTNLALEKMTADSKVNQQASVGNG